MGIKTKITMKALGSVINEVKDAAPNIISHVTDMTPKILNQIKAPIIKRKTETEEIISDNKSVVLINTDYRMLTENYRIHSLGYF